MVLISKQDAAKTFRRFLSQDFEVRGQTRLFWTHHECHEPIERMRKKSAQDTEKTVCAEAAEEQERAAHAAAAAGRAETVALEI